jgi:hypothetical protein
MYLSASHHIHLAASVILVWLSAGFGYTKGAGMCQFDVKNGVSKRHWIQKLLIQIETAHS